MHIEISIEKEQPLSFPLNKTKIILGSSPDCDIVVPQKNISRKHLVILSKNQSYYVVDQNSTNGSFLNDVKLVPGTEVELTAFLPLRLGTKVLLTLHHNEAELEAPPEDVQKSDNSLRNFFKEEAQETTKMISLKDLNKASTAKLVKKKAEVVSKKLTPKEQKLKEKKKLQMIGLLCLSAFAAAAYYNLKVVKEEVAPAVVTAPQVAEAQTPVKRVAEADLPKVEKLMQLKTQARCTQPLAKELCFAVPSINEGVWGAVEDEKNFIIYADGAKYMQQAKAFVRGPSTTATYKTDLNLMMIAVWVKENIPVSLQNLSKFEKLTLALMDPTNQQGELVVAAVFTPESLLRLRKRLDEAQFERARKEGALTISYAFDYLTIL